MYEHEKKLISLLTSGNNQIIESYYREPFFHVVGLDVISKLVAEDLTNYCYKNKIHYTINIAEDKEHFLFIFIKL